MIDICKYHEILRDYDIKEDHGHLILPNKLKYMRDITRDLFTALGDLRADNKNFRLQKLTTCGFSNCVSPQCHTFKLKSVIENSILSKEDIIDIANEMDLNRIEEIGIDDYLREYNDNLPEVLKISKSDFRTIYAYMKGNQK